MKFIKIPLLCLALIADSSLKVAHASNRAPISLDDINGESNHQVSAFEDEFYRQQELASSKTHGQSSGGFDARALMPVCDWLNYFSKTARTTIENILNEEWSTTSVRNSAFGFTLYRPDVSDFEFFSFLSEFMQINKQVNVLNVGAGLGGPTFTVVHALLHFGLPAMKGLSPQASPPYQFDVVEINDECAYNLKMTAKNTAKKHFKTVPDANVHIHTMDFLKYTSKIKYDFIIYKNVAHFLRTKNVDKHLKKIASLLKPNGVLYWQSTSVFATNQVPRFSLPPFTSFQTQGTQNSYLMDLSTVREHFTKAKLVPADLYYVASLGDVALIDGRTVKLGTMKVTLPEALISHMDQGAYVTKVSSFASKSEDKKVHQKPTSKDDL